jgi:hypothetical protein
MSWLNGQILGPKDLLKKGFDIGSKFKFMEDVKLWVDHGNVYQSIPAKVVGVFLGAEGRTHYKLALEIEGTGLYSVIEAPSADISDKDVTTWTGPDWVADAEEVKQKLGVATHRPSMEPVITEFGRKIALARQFMVTVTSIALLASKDEDFAFNIARIMAEAEASPHYPERLAYKCEDRDLRDWELTFLGRTVEMTSRSTDRLIAVTYSRPNDRPVSETRKYLKHFQHDGLVKEVYQYLTTGKLDPSSSCLSNE